MYGVSDSSPDSYLYIYYIYKVVDLCENRIWSCCEYVAMLMVLLLHATFETMHYPSPKLVQAAPDSWLGIILTNQACLCCVDVFVLITGWFGTHFKMQNVWKLLYQVAFISLTITVGISLWSGGLPGSPLQIAQSVLGYWFINSYLVMYLLSPVLNSFTEQQGEAEQRHFLLVFFGLSIPASFLFEDLDRGFSAVSFCGLYLLGVTCVCTEQPGSNTSTAVGFWEPLR